MLQSEAASEAAKAATRETLLRVLEALQRALHPFMPFITEEIWQRVAPLELRGDGDRTVMLQPYPTPAEYPVDAQAEHEVAWIQKFILAVRQIRGEMDISPSRRLPVVLKGATAADVELIDRHRPYLERLAGLEGLMLLDADSDCAPIRHCAD